MSQIICKDLTLGYEGNAVCSGLDLVVEKGDYLCIVGDNGSGKTTFMRALLSLKPALSGTISFGDGISARDIGYLPQQTDIQRDFPASVWEVVLSGTLGKRGMKPFYSSKEKNLASGCFFW